MLTRRTWEDSKNKSDEQNCSDYNQKNYRTFNKNYDGKQKSNKHNYSKDGFSTKIKDEEEKWYVIIYNSYYLIMAGMWWML